MRLAILITSCAMPAMAQDFSLAMPVDCTLDDTCYIQSYVDHDPSTAASDFQCSPMTYDGHKGTDFGLPSLAAMEDGVTVLAAAPGIVRGVRNDMRDILYTADLDGEINGRDCGNGVVIDHGDGWETQYCHLREGSVSVLTGDIVETGDPLGLIGLSGRTQFPHLHLSLRRDGQVVDPFDPNDIATCDGPIQETLWSTAIPTPTGGLLTTGFANAVPDYNDAKAGTAAAQTLSKDAPIVLWAFAFGAQPGDTLSLEINGPNGPIFQSDDVLDRQQALFMRAGGTRAPETGFESGTYTGLVIHARNGVELDRQTQTITLP